MATARVLLTGLMAAFWEVELLAVEAGEAQAADLEAAETSRRFRFPVCR